MAARAPRDTDRPVRRAARGIACPQDPVELGVIDTIGALVDPVTIRHRSSLCGARTLRSSTHREGTPDLVDVEVSTDNKLSGIPRTHFFQSTSAVVLVSPARIKLAMNWGGAISRSILEPQVLELMERRALSAQRDCRDRPQGTLVSRAELDSGNRAIAPQ
jgi:hypothetical protein